MRVAQIGDDGQIYDADGNAYSDDKRLAKKIKQQVTARTLGQYPQMKEYAHREHARPVEWYPRTYTDSPLQPMTKTSYNPHENVSWYLRGLPEVKNARPKSRRPRGLGQAAPTPDIPNSCLAPDGGGMATKAAKAVATPLSGYTFSLKAGDSSNTVYPGRFVISDRYPDVLFRVAFRAASNPGSVQLLTLQGQGAGNYIEIPIDGNDPAKPSLMQNFLVVPRQCEWSIENSYVNPMPAGATDLEKQKFSFNYSVSLISQASYNLSSINSSYDAAGFRSAFTETFALITSAVAMAIEGLDMTAASYDYELIGTKEFNILFRVGSSIFEKAASLYAMVQPGVAGSLATVDDLDKIAAFQDTVNNVSGMAGYWGGLLTRAIMYNQQSILFSIMMADYFQRQNSDYNVQMFTAMMDNRDKVLEGITGKDEPGKGPITAARAVELFNETKKMLSDAYLASLTSEVGFEKFYSDQLFGDIPINAIPVYYYIYDELLKSNAKDCLALKALADGMNKSGVPQFLDGYRGRARGMGRLGAAAPGNVYREDAKKVMVTDMMTRAADYIKTENAKLEQQGHQPSVGPVEASRFIAKSFGSVLDVSRELYLSKELNKDPLEIDTLIMNRAQAMSDARGNAETLLNNPTAAARVAEAQRYWDREMVGREAGLVKQAIKSFDSKLRTSLLNLETSAVRTSEELQTRLTDIATVVTEALSEEGVDEQGNPVRRYIAGMLGVTGSGEDRASFSSRSAFDIASALRDSGLFTSRSFGALYKGVAEDFQVSRDQVVEQGTKELRYIEDVLAGNKGEGQIERQAMIDRGEDPKTFVLSDRKKRKMDSMREGINAVMREFGIAPLAAATMLSQAEAILQKAKDRIDAAASAGRPLQKMDGELYSEALLLSDLGVLQRGDAKGIFEAYLKPENKAVKDEFDKDPDAKQAMNLLRAAYDKLEAAQKSLKSLIASGKPGEANAPLISAVTSAMDNSRQALKDFQTNFDKVIDRWGTVSWSTKIWNGITYVWNKAWEVIWGKYIVNVANKSKVVATIIGIFHYPLALSIVLAPVYLIFRISLKHLPYPFILDILVKIKNLDVNKGLWDESPIPGEKSEDITGQPGMEPTTKFLILTIGISAIFFGDKFFPAITGMFGAVGKAIDSFTKIITGKSGGGKKGAGPGRPPGEKRGPGRPPMIKASGGKVPPGIVGWILR